MLSRLGVLFLFVLCVQPVCAASSKGQALQFEIPIVQGAEKYLELLEYPAYLVVALENNGIKTSNMGRPMLIDERTIQFKKAMLHFAEKKGVIYSYKGSLEWYMPLKHLKFEVPVEIDTSSASKGNIQVSVFLPLANLFPVALVERIRIKIQTLSRPEIQKQMLVYFDDLSKKTDHASGLQSLFSKIMLQSYGAVADAGKVCTSREPGDAESLSDQAYLLATLAIWLIIGPGSIVVFISWRNRKNRNQEKNLEKNRPSRI